MYVFYAVQITTVSECLQGVNWWIQWGG